MLGPTGAGKSQLALLLARRFSGEVVSCDSVQAYCGLNVGAAKLSPAERLGIPHHLIDVVNPGDNLTAGEYVRIARPVLKEIRRRDHNPIVVGGTGFYLKALLDGLSPAPARDEKLRVRLAALARRRPNGLHRILSVQDPVAASRIHPNDHQKLIRAIELSMLAKQPASDTQSRPREGLTGYAVLKLGLSPDRKMLHSEINRRTEQMFREGLLEETESLLRAGYSTDVKALQSLGYKQAVNVLSGNLSLADAIRECQTKTRQYAKRQMTWFRVEQGVHWLTGFGNDPDVQAAAVREVQDFTTSA